MTPDLQTLIDLFVESHPEYASYEGANGCCGLAFDEFCELAEEMGFPETLIEEINFTNNDRLIASVPDMFHYEAAPHFWYHGGCRWLGHCVARIGNACIDFTARQFHPEAPFPLIFQMA